MNRFMAGLSVISGCLAVLCFATGGPIGAGVILAICAVIGAFAAGGRYE